MFSSHDDFVIHFAISFISPLNCFDRTNVRPFFIFPNNFKNILKKFCNVKISRMFAVTKYLSMAVQQIVRPKENKHYKKISKMERGDKTNINADERQAFYNAIIAYKKDTGFSCITFKSVTSKNKKTVTFQRIL